jgi:hypothetical protein
MRQHTRFFATLIPLILETAPVYLHGVMAPPTQAPRNLKQYQSGKYNFPIPPTIRP